jgi:flagellar transcriptional activator FlhC
MRNKSVITEARQIDLAVELIKLGARLAVLEAETNLSRERLLKLYKEVMGKSPPKGMLPYSTDWFISWRPNIHASLFIDTYRYLEAHAGVSGIEAIVKAYQLYLEHLETQGLERVMSITRAWSLVRFFDAKMLSTVPCTRCKGHFVVNALDLNRGYVCGMCDMPSRAGQTKEVQAARVRTLPPPAPAAPAILAKRKKAPLAKRTRAKKPPFSVLIGRWTRRARCYAAATVAGSALVATTHLPSRAQR